MNQKMTNYLETFGLMCSLAEFPMVELNRGRVENIHLLIEEAQKFEEFHKNEAAKLAPDLDYWCEEINGSWYDAADTWLNEFYKKGK